MPDSIQAALDTQARAGSELRRATRERKETDPARRTAQLERIKKLQDAWDKATAELQKATDAEAARKGLRRGPRNP